jgi:L-idonate 5-dehydrogenase
VDLTPLLTGVFGLDEAIRAFEIAGDRSQSMKVQLSF